MGRLTNHYNNDMAVVLGSQLQYRLTSNMWLTGGGRLEKLMHFNAKLPLSGQLGVQYDLNNEKRIDILKNYWRWYVQGDLGFRNAFFNMDNISFGGAAGINITPEHGARIEFIGTKPNEYDGLYHNWISVSPEYVFNFTNQLLGEDDHRKVDVELLGGIDFMMHSKNFKNTEIGLGFGAQVNAYVNKSIAVFIEPRFSVQPFDKIVAPSSHDKVQYFTLFGLRYTHNRFKSMKE